MIPVSPRRSLLVVTLAFFLAFLAEALPRALQLNAQSRVGFLSARAGASALLFLAGGVLMGAVDPPRAIWWGLVVGSGTLVHFLLRMLSQRPPSLWPLAVLLAAVFGWAPAMFGALLGRRLRDRAPPSEREA